MTDRPSDNEVTGSQRNPVIDAAVAAMKPMAEGTLFGAWRTVVAVFRSPAPGDVRISLYGGPPTLRLLDGAPFPRVCHQLLSACALDGADIPLSVVFWRVHIRGLGENTFVSSNAVHGGPSDSIERAIACVSG